jgi:hypothetical protein
MGPKKLIPYLELGKGGTVADALGALHGAIHTDVLPVYVDQILPRWIEGRH